MEASVLDLRRGMRNILAALDRNEPVIILHRGKRKGTLYPDRGGRKSAASATVHPAFGMWKDLDDMKDVDGVVRNLRKGRFHAV
jgi:hypothetical protein